MGHPTREADDQTQRLSKKKYQTRKDMEYFSVKLANYPMIAYLSRLSLVEVDNHEHTWIIDIW